MATVTLPYGRSTLQADLPSGWRVQYLRPRSVPGCADQAGAVAQALAAPVDGITLSHWAGVTSAAIAVNDNTRPVPHHLLLPPLLRELEALGLRPEAIRLMIASGTHTPLAPDEFCQVIPAEILGRYPVVAHDCMNTASLVALGETRRGTPVTVNREFLQADLRIVVGNIELHPFMGMSGGVKSAAIGLAGRATIDTNHRMMTHPSARPGSVADNVIRQDTEEIGEMIGVHFALNAILNDRREIVTALAGAPAAVMKHGVPVAQDLFQVRIPHLFDLVLASPGGHPKDINFYQAQKGLSNAARAVRPGGVIVLAAACPEGSGSRIYESFMDGMASFADVRDRFEQGPFRVGWHKAYQIACDAGQSELITVTGMPVDLAERLLLCPACDLNAAIAAAADVLPADASVCVMPYAGATCPVLEGQTVGSAYQSEQAAAA